MIAILFVGNIVLAFAVALATAMLQNHFSRIEKSLDLYINPKAYKPHGQVAFITAVLDRLRNNAINDCEEDVEKTIEICFYLENVGKFSYKLVQNIAMGGKVVMWSFFLIQIGVELLSPSPGYSVTKFTYIVGSGLLCLFFTIVGVVESLPERRMKLLHNVEEFVLHTYPMAVSSRAKQKDYQEILDNLDCFAIPEVLKEETEKENALNEEDIRLFLQTLDKDA